MKPTDKSGHVYDFWIENFRVATVTTTLDRVEKMIGALRSN